MAPSYLLSGIGVRRHVTQLCQGLESLLQHNHWTTKRFLQIQPSYRYLFHSLRHSLQCCSLKILSEFVKHITLWHSILLEAFFNLLLKLEKVLANISTEGWILNLLSLVRHQSLEISLLILLLHSNRYLFYLQSQILKVFTV